LLLTSKEASNLNSESIRELRAGWEGLTRPPWWKRPLPLALTTGALVMFTLCALEIGWRWPLRIWQSDLLKDSIPRSDNLKDPKSGKWDCGPPQQSCEQYFKEDSLLLPKGVVATTGEGWFSNKSLYDFGLLLRVQMLDSNSVSLFYRQYPYPKNFDSGRSGYRFTVTRSLGAAKTSVRLEGKACDARGCNTTLRYDVEPFLPDICATGPEADFLFEAAVVGKHFVTRITFNPIGKSYPAASGTCSRDDVLQTQFSDDRWLPHAPFGNLALGGADGSVRFIQEVTLYSAKEAWEALAPVKP
jgi:hypothetical protein